MVDVAFGVQKIVRKGRRQPSTLSMDAIIGEITEDFVRGRGPVDERDVDVAALEGRRNVLGGYLPFSGVRFRTFASAAWAWGHL